VNHVFQAALKTPADRRKTLLDDICAADLSLRREVEDLLGHDETGSRDGFLESPLGAAGKALLSEPDPLIGRELGPYRIHDLLGEGGMGVVYRAEQTKPIRRSVALKLIKIGMDTREVIARFESERQALALMSHPHVAAVHDAGATEQGRPFFVMEYVPGLPITDYCDQHRLSVAKRLELFVHVCEAIQHAHQKGIIHRDIKPSNVLVAPQDGSPAVKVIDFGVAKAIHQRLTEGSLLTAQGRLVGTLAYMSPEQMEFGAVDIDTRTDVYSLGVLLYELLVGVPPFDPRLLDRADYAEVHRIVREVEPPKPSSRLNTLSFAPHGADRVTDGIGGSDVASSVQVIVRCRRTNPKTLMALLRGDLDWIVMKCLEKDRSRRYDTANNLATEIRRYLNHEPVLAGPPSVRYRAGKFVSRHRKGASAVLLGTVLLLGAAAVASWEAVRATRERDRAVAAERLAQAHLSEAEAVGKFLSDMLSAVRPEARGPDVTVREILDEASAAIDEQFADTPLTEASLRSTIGLTYLKLGLYDPAQAHLAMAVRLARQALGENHRVTLTAINNLGIALGLEGNVSDAVSTARRTFEIQRRVLGEEDPVTLQSMSNLAANLILQGKWSEAKVLTEKWLESGRRVFGPEHPYYLVATHNLALVLESEGNWAAAEDQYRKTLETQRRVQGAEHPDTLRSLDGLARTLNSRGRWTEAAARFTEAIEIKRRVLSSEHLDTLQSENNLASVLRNQGKHAEAEQLVRTALPTAQRVLGERHRITLALMKGLVLSSGARGDWADAETLARKTLMLEQAAQGEDHPESLYTVRLVAHTLAQQGKSVEAEEWIRKALPVHRRVLGEEHNDTLLILWGLANVLSDQEKFAEAEGLYHQLLDTLPSTMGEDHPVTLRLRDNFGYYVLLKQGRYAESETLHRKTSETMRRVLGEDDDGTTESMQNLALALDHTGKTDEAEQLQRKVVDRRRKKYGAEHPEVGVSLYRLARIVGQRGRHAEAEELAREGSRICAAKFSPDHPEALKAAAVLGAVLVSRGQFAEAESVLLATYDLLNRRGEPNSALQREVLESIVRVYEGWGKSDRSAHYRSLLHETTRPSAVPN